MSQGDNTLSDDRVFDLISNRRRRYVLTELKHRDGPVEITTLAEELAAVENDIPLEEVTSEARRRVYVSLYQTHVPKLAEAGLVNADAGTVTLADGNQSLEQYLGRYTERPRWYRYYGALATASIALVVGATTGILAVGQLLVGIGISVAFLCTAAVHAVHRHGDLPINAPLLLSE